MICEPWIDNANQLWSYVRILLESYRMMAILLSTQNFPVVFRWQCQLISRATSTSYPFTFCLFVCFSFLRNWSNHFESIYKIHFIPTENRILSNNPNSIWNFLKAFCIWFIMSGFNFFFFSLIVFELKFWTF